MANHSSAREWLTDPIELSHPAVYVNRRVRRFLRALASEPPTPFALLEPDLILLHFISIPITHYTTARLGPLADYARGIQSMPNVDIDLGDLPYLVAVHHDENLAFEPAKIDDKGHGVLQQLKHDPPSGPTTPRLNVGRPSHNLAGPSMRSATAGMREVEFAQRVEPVQKAGLVVSSLRGFGFCGINDPASFEATIIRATDVPIKESMAITFAWPGLPLVQAYPITTDSSLHLTRSQLASLLFLLISNYFTWALNQSGQAAIPYMPWEYNMDPHGFFRRFVRVLRLVEMGDGSWTPVLGVAGLEAGPGGKWRIPVAKCDDCEKGVCQAAT